MIKVTINGVEKKAPTKDLYIVEALIEIRVNLYRFHLEDAVIDRLLELSASMDNYIVVKRYLSANHLPKEIIYILYP